MYIIFKYIAKAFTWDWKFTLYPVPLKFFTAQGRTASCPTATVIFGRGFENSGRFCGGRLLLSIRLIPYPPAFVPKKLA